MQGEIGKLSDLESSHNLTENYNKALNEIIKRESAAEEYIEVLKNTAAAHEELSNEFIGKQTMNSQKLKEKCDKFFAEGKQLKKKSQNQSFQKNILFISNINTQKIKEIVYRYQLSTSPRIEKIKDAFN